MVKMSVVHGNRSRRKAVSAYTVVEDANTVADWQQFYDSIEFGQIDFDICGEANTALIKSRYQQFSPAQQKIFLRLSMDVMFFVEMNFGLENWDQPDQKWCWNWHCWCRLLLKLCESTSRDDQLEFLDCWRTELSTTVSTPRPRIRLDVGRLCLAIDTRTRAKKQQLIFVKYPDLPDTIVYVSQLMAVINTKRAPEATDQGSHLCHNVPQLCFNPNHLLWEDDFSNKWRNGCIYGAACYCPHEPKCVFTDANGRYLPHRNKSTWEECDCEEGNCHTVTICSPAVPKAKQEIIAEQIAEPPAMPEPADE